jgi:hypothetical protein
MIKVELEVDRGYQNAFQTILSVLLRTDNAQVELNRLVKIPPLAHFTGSLCMMGYVPNNGAISARVQRNSNPM